MLLEKCMDRAKAAGRTIVLPEGDDPRVQTAAARLAAQGIARILLIGGVARGCETLDPAGDPRSAELADLI